MVRCLGCTHWRPRCRQPRRALAGHAATRRGSPLPAPLQSAGLHLSLFAMRRTAIMQSSFITIIIYCLYHDHRYYYYYSLDDYH